MALGGLHSPADTQAEILVLEVGAKVRDGTIYAGLSPDTNEPMYALPADAPLTMTWRQAMDYVARFEGQGRMKGAFRLPTESELNILFQHRAKIGGFNESGSYPGSWYRSSAEHREFPGRAWVQRFDDGFRGADLKSSEASLRLIRN